MRTCLLPLAISRNLELRELTMRQSRHHSASQSIVLVALATIVAVACSAQAAVPKLLVQTKISPGAYYHESIPTAVDVITALGNGSLALNSSVADPSVANSKAKWEVVHIDTDQPMEDASYLAQFAAVAFVSTK